MGSCRHLRLVLLWFCIRGRCLWHFGGFPQERKIYLMITSVVLDAFLTYFQCFRRGMLIMNNEAEDETELGAREEYPGNVNISAIAYFCRLRWLIFCSLHAYPIMELRHVMKSPAMGHDGHGQTTPALTSRMHPLDDRDLDALQHTVEAAICSHPRPKPLMRIPVMIFMMMHVISNRPPSSRQPGNELILGEERPTYTSQTTNTLSAQIPSPWLPAFACSLVLKSCTLVYNH